MSRTTRKSLRQEVAIGTVAEQAEKDWRAKQRNKQTFTQWLIWAVPFLMIIVFGVFFWISAPHTSGFINMITPGTKYIAPIGFEGALLILAVVVEVENRKNKTSIYIMWVLLFVNIVINFAGATTNILFGITSAPETASLQLLATHIREMTFLQLLGNFGTLPAYEQVSLFLGFIVGPFTPFMTKFTGEYLVKLATGRIVLSAEKLDDIWLKERTRVLYQALLRAALTAGAGNKTASEFAANIAETYYRDFAEDDYDDYVDAQSMGSVASAPMQVQPAMRQEFGFVGMVRDNTGQRDKLSTRPVTLENGNTNVTKHAVNGAVLRVQPSNLSKMSQELVIEWVQSNHTELETLVDGISGKRNRCKAISKYLTGDESGYKTVGRAMDKLGIEL